MGNDNISKALQDQDLRHMILPVLRADFTALDNYKYKPGGKLWSDIQCFTAEGEALTENGILSQTKQRV